MFIFFTVVSVFIFTGCVTTIMKDPWVVNAQYNWYIPSVIYGSEEASANLKNAQDSVYINNRKPSEITVDKYSLRATMRWEEIEEKTQKVSYSGGSFYGWDYVPSFGTTEQVTNITHNKEDSVTVAFKDIDNIVILDNAVYVNMDGGKSIGFVTNGGISLQKLADSFYSLSYALGKRLKLDAGFSYANMTARQAALLDMDSGIYVPWVFRGSPAVKAGLDVNDVILEVNGEKITKTTSIDSVVASVIADAGKKGYFTMKVYHWEKQNDGSIKWEIRTLKIYPVER
jgi:hypothetical protein